VVNERIIAQKLRQGNFFQAPVGNCGGEFSMPFARVRHLWQATWRRSAAFAES
jgi:hypothetical protein